jgi:uncharacterized glyoxalase superfamily protein PhnB
MMALELQFWGSLYGSVTNKLGINWIFSGRPTNMLIIQLKSY